MNVVKIWHRLFLEEQSSIGLSFFRIFVGLTTGLHVIPAFFALQDNFLSTGLKVYNANFFTPEVLRLVWQSPDWFVQWMVYVFLIFWGCFMLGWRTQLSCIGMTLCCYYFYALNSFHIGTLSWDILLVTLFLMCLTPYAGDYFSLDALRHKDIRAWGRLRPIFIQRLLQIQIALTYFYTAIYKISPQGNWITGNPIYALVNYPQVGVTKNFLFREWLMTQPHVCYWIGITVVAVELLMPLLLFWKVTRRSAIILGIIFHITLILTLDVPAIFFFLFPAQLLLFIEPKAIVCWIEGKRKAVVPMTVLYDGKCGFCRRWVLRLQVMDLWGRLSFEPVENNLSEIKLNDGVTTYGGFDAFRRLCLALPMLYPLVLLVYLPGATWIGRLGYGLVAKNRYLLHRSCNDQHCTR